MSAGGHRAASPSTFRFLSLSAICLALCTMLPYINGVCLPCHLLLHDAAMAALPVELSLPVQFTSAGLHVAPNSKLGITGSSFFHAGRSAH